MQFTPYANCSTIDDGIHTPFVYLVYLVTNTRVTHILPLSMMEYTVCIPCNLIHAYCNSHSSAILPLLQYHFVLQSLTLWRDIAHDMFKLWMMCEGDLLDASNPYEQVDTGQGMHRLQQCPRTGKSMHRLLYDTQQRVERWVGSSVIHLGEKNVPNVSLYSVERT